MSSTQLSSKVSRTLLTRELRLSAPDCWLPESIPEAVRQSLISCRSKANVFSGLSFPAMLICQILGWGFRSFPGGKTGKATRRERVLASRPALPVGPLWRFISCSRLRLMPTRPSKPSESRSSGLKTQKAVNSSQRLPGA